MSIETSLALLLAAGVTLAGQEEVAKWDPGMAKKNAVVDTNAVKWIDGKCLPLEGRAFLETEHYYDRLPVNVTTNVNGGVRMMKHHTSGMLFRFRTDSKNLHFKWTPYSTELSLDHMPSTSVSGIDVYRFDEVAGLWRYMRTGRIYDPKGGALTLAWTPGDACIVNLPLYNGVKSFKLGIDPKAKVESLGPRKSGVNKPVVFYGTSITHGGCCSRPGLGFVNIVGRRLDVPVVNLGFSGSGRGELEMSDHMAAIDASCYVLDCVHNMPNPLMKERYEPFVRHLRALRPGVPIVLAEGCDVYCGVGNLKDMKERNAFVKPLYDRLVNEGWKKLYYLPSAGQYADDFEGTVDGTHPNDWGMMNLAKAFEEIVGKALGLRQSGPRWDRDGVRPH